MRLIWLALASFLATIVYAGKQTEEALSANVATVLQRAISEKSTLGLTQTVAAERWLINMSRRLHKRVPERLLRHKLLTILNYEARRAGLDPQLVLAIIDVESDFRHYAISTAGARGLMQVMPFWVKLIGTPQHNLFDMQTNLRFGCTILRYYLDQEKGNLSRALSRYNGSVGKRKYANAVLTALHTRWHYSTEQRMVSKERPKGFLQTRAPQ